MSEIVQSILLEDGRKAERRITEAADGCNAERTVELWAEKPLPKFLKQRVIEKEQPVVVERETQIFDDNDVQIETRRESLNPCLKTAEVSVNKPQDDLLAKMQQVVESAVQPLRDDIDNIKSQLAPAPSMRKQVSMQSLLEGQTEEKKLTLWDWAGIGVIVAQIGAVVYFLCFF